MDTIESQLVVRNKCDQLQKSIKELYDWTADIKKAESARAAAENEEVSAGGQRTNRYSLVMLTKYYFNFFIRSWL